MTQLIWNGLALGSFYGLIGIGLAIVRGLWGILNLSQGDFMILGGYIVFILVSSGVNVVLAIVIGVVVLGVLMALVARGTFHFTQQDLVNGFILSTGIGLIIQNTLELTMASKSRDIVISGLGTAKIFGASVPWIRLIFFFATIVIVIATSWFLKRTKMGRYIRAAALNSTAAKLVGINVNRVEFASYILSGMLAAVAGVGLLVQFVVTPYLGTRYVLKGTAAMLLGGAYKGIGNIGSTYIVGLILGAVECFGVMFTSSKWQDLFAYLLLYAGLLLANRTQKRKLGA